MPEIHDGLDSSPEPPPQGDLSASSGPPFTPPHLVPGLGPHAITQPCPQLCTPKPWPRTLCPQKPVESGSDLPHALSVRETPPPALQPVEKWTVLGRSVWQANRSFFRMSGDEAREATGKEMRPPRDVPAWLRQGPAGESLRPTEDLLFGPLHEAELPLHYGIQLHCGFQGDGQIDDTIPRLPANSMSAVEWPVREVPSPPLLEFPISIVPEESRPYLPVIQHDDGVLPFRAPAKQTIAVFFAYRRYWPHQSRRRPGAPALREWSAGTAGRHVVLQPGAAALRCGGGPPGRYPQFLSRQRWEEPDDQPHQPGGGTLRRR